MSNPHGGTPWGGTAGSTRNRSSKARYIAAAVVVLVCIAVTRGLVLAASSSLASGDAVSGTTLATLPSPTTATAVDPAAAGEDFRWDQLPEFDDQIAADLLALEAGSSLSLTMSGDPLSDGGPVVRGALTGVVVGVSDLIYSAQRPSASGGGRIDPVAFQVAMPSDSEVNSSAQRAAAAAGTIDLEFAFQNAAAMEGVPVDLLKAISWVESRWRPDARSYVGAMGMMQLMPRTAEWLSSQIGGSPSALNPWNPEHNIRMGARFIAYLIQWANGDLERALIAYNQGPGSLVSKGVYPSARRYAYMVMELRSRFGGPIFTPPPSTAPPATEATTASTEAPVTTVPPTTESTSSATSAPVSTTPSTAPVTTAPPTTAPATTAPPASSSTTTSTSSTTLPPSSSSSTP